MFIYEAAGKAGLFSLRSQHRRRPYSHRGRDWYSYSADLGFCERYNRHYRRARCARYRAGIMRPPPRELVTCHRSKSATDRIRLRRSILLADAGLLNGRRATTHWASCVLLGERYPSLKVEPDAIFVRDDPIWTSAGVSAGIDLSLAMVQDDCGHRVAMQVARQLVVYMKRPGGQSQFSELLQSQTKDSPVFDELHLWIEKNLKDQKLTVDMLAAQVNMSPRNFARSYKARTGRTPAKALELFRVEAARRLLEEAKLNVDEIARSCGFGDEERMRATFKRHLAISPRDYRRRFSILSSVSAKRRK